MKYEVGPSDVAGADTHPDMGAGARSQSGFSQRYHLPQERASSPPEKLPELPSGGPDRTVLDADLQGHQAMGEGDQAGSRLESDAPLVRRSTLWALQQRPVSQTGRD